MDLTQCGLYLLSNLVPRVSLLTPQSERRETLAQAGHESPRPNKILRRGPFFTKSGGWGESDPGRILTIRGYFCCNMNSINGRWLKISKKTLIVIPKKKKEAKKVHVIACFNHNNWSFWGKKVMLNSYVHRANMWKIFFPSALKLHFGEVFLKLNFTLCLSDWIRCGSVLTIKL